METAVRIIRYISYGAFFGFATQGFVDLGRAIEANTIPEDSGWWYMLVASLAFLVLNLVYINMFYVDKDEVEEFHD